MAVTARFINYIPGRIINAVKPGIFSAFFLCAEAATAIEFAIVLPLLLLMVFGIIEFCLVMYESSTLEGALTTASRAGQTGYPDTNDNGTIGGARWNYTLGTLYSQTKGLLDPARIQFAPVAYADFASVDQPGRGLPNNIGGSDAVVVYSAAYPYPVLPFMRSFFGNNNMMVTSVVVKNEAFNPNMPPVVLPEPPPSPPPQCPSPPGAGPCPPPPHNPPPKCPSPPGSGPCPPSPPPQHNPPPPPPPNPTPVPLPTCAPFC